MANTFKVFTIANVAEDSSTFSTIYTCATSTTGIVLGLNICNKDASDQDVTVKLTSNTGNRTGANDGDNVNVTLLNEVSVPADSTLSLIDTPIYLDETDLIAVTAGAASDLDYHVSYVELVD